MNELIGPTGRVIIGQFAGLAILLFGHFRIKKDKLQGSILEALGGGIMLLTSFAGKELHNIFSAEGVIAICAIVTIFMAFSSVKNNSRALAITAIIFGGIAPLLTNSYTDNFISLFSYLFILSAGFLWVIKLKNWRILTPLSLLTFGVYSLNYFPLPSTISSLSAMTCATAFCLLFYAANLTAITQSKELEQSDLLTAALNAFVILGWIKYTATEEAQGLFSALFAIIFLAATYLISKKTNFKDALHVYTGISLTMLGAAAAFELSGPSLVVTLCILITSFSVIAAKTFKDLSFAEKISTLLIIPMSLSIESISSPLWQNGIFHSASLVLSLLLISFIGLGIFFYKERKNHQLETKSDIINFLFFMGGIYFIVLVWLASQALIENENTAKAVSLIFYTVVGLSFSLKGRLEEKNYLKIPGNILLSLVVLRMLFVEFWLMSIPGRIISFFIVGVLLVASSFIKKKN
jgi:uncharacterized membrane protein